MTERDNDRIPGERLPGERLPGERIPGERIPGEPVRGESASGEPVRDPLADDPNRPHRNPNMIHPAPRSADVDHRPDTARARSSSTWVWILVGGIALIAIFSFFTVGTGDRGDVSTTGTVPQQTAPATDPAVIPPPAVDPARPVVPQ